MVQPRKKRTTLGMNPDLFRLGRQRALEYEDTGLSISSPADLPGATENVEETENDKYLRRLAYILQAEVALGNLDKATAQRELKIWYDRLQTEDITKISQTTPPPFWKDANPSTSEVEWQLAVNVPYQKKFAEKQVDYGKFQLQQQKQATQRFSARSVLKPGEKGGIPELQWQTDEKTGKRFLTYSSPGALSMEEMDTAIRGREEQLGGMLQAAPITPLLKPAPPLPPELQRPTNWIDKWRVEHGAFQRKPGWQTPEDVMEQVTLRKADLLALDAWIAANPPQVQFSDYWAKVEGWKVSLPAELEQLRGIEERFIKASPEELETGRRMGATEDVLPPAEKWLARLAPGLKEGQPIKKLASTQIPSLQQWAATPSSQRTKYAEYLDWAGLQSDDIFEEMQRRRTATPYVPSQWAASRQG